MYIKKSRFVIVIIAVVLVTVMVTATLLNPFGGVNFDKFMKFIGVTRLINSTYYEDIDMGEAAEMAIAGVATSTGDPYTMYLWGDAAKEYMEDITGDYCGVGLYIEKDFDENLISVVSPIADSVADKAGIKTGDKILAIDGVSFIGDELSEAASVMRGEEGTEVKLLIRDSITNDEKEIALIRSRIILDSVNGEMIDDKIGYISISQFIEGSSDDFADELKSLTENGMKSLIVDLRNNPGGILDEAIEICGCFLEKDDMIVYTEDKNGNKTEYFSKKKLVDLKYELPVVILINGGSASASEVITGAFRDYELAEVLGEKSYGKGVVQGVLSVGEDILSVTMSRYFSPKGICIHGEGITPDITVEMDPNKSALSGSLNFEEDEQLSAAIKLLKE